MIDIAGMLAEKKAVLRELQEDVRALERVKRMSPNGVQSSLPIESNASTVLLSEMQKKRTQKEAIDYYADQSDGRVKVNDLKQLLIKAGFIKGKHQYAYGHIYAMLKNDDRYEHLGNGAFQRQPTE